MEKKKVKKKIQTEDLQDVEEYEATGTKCFICKEPQYETPGGVCCKNGHGGAQAAEDEDFETPEVSETQYGFLVKELAGIDVMKIYEKLKPKLMMGKLRMDVDSLSEALDESAKLAYEASQLSIIAKTQLAKFTEFTFRLKFAELATEARTALAKEKAAGTFSGQVTKDAVDNWIALNHPGYKKLIQEKLELEMAVEAFKSLANQFESRKSILQSQGRLAERKRVIVGGME